MMPTSAFELLTGEPPGRPPCTAEELGCWRRVALTDRYDGLWVLAATSGMRRSELAGVRRSLLDLDGQVLALEDTRVVVDGRAEDSDGKSAAGRRLIALDDFTVKHLRRYVARIDVERDAFGPSYAAGDVLAVGPDGVRVHPDTLTRRFNRLVDRAGVPRIRLHDVRHTYATLAMDAGVNPRCSATAWATPTPASPCRCTPTDRPAGTARWPTR